MFTAYELSDNEPRSRREDVRDLIVLLLLVIACIISGVMDAQGAEFTVENRCAPVFTVENKVKDLPLREGYLTTLFPTTYKGREQLWVSFTKTADPKGEWFGFGVPLPPKTLILIDGKKELLRDAVVWVSRHRGAYFRLYCDDPKPGENAVWDSGWTLKITTTGKVTPTDNGHDPALVIPSGYEWVRRDSGSWVVELTGQDRAAPGVAAQSPFVQGGTTPTTRGSTPTFVGGAATSSGTDPAAGKGSPTTFAPDAIPVLGRRFLGMGSSYQNCSPTG